MTNLWLICRICVFFLFIFALVGIGSSFGMEVLVSLPNGQTVTVPYTSESTVSDVKEFVFNVSDIQTINQQMFKGSIELDNAKTLESYGIADRDTLVVRYSTGGSPLSGGKSGGILKIAILVVIIAGVILGIRKILS